MTSSSWPGTSPRLSRGSGSCPTSGATGPCRADSSLKAGPGVGTGLVQALFCPPYPAWEPHPITALLSLSGRPPGWHRSGHWLPLHAPPLLRVRSTPHPQQDWKPHGARRCPAVRGLGLESTSWLCDGGQVASPLWDSVSSSLKQEWRSPMTRSGDTTWKEASTAPGAGVFFLSSAEGEQISFLFDCIVRGISPTKGPFGLRPVLPDPSPPGPSTVEERVAQEALETLQLEKRLSLLSHAGRPGSGGDDRSLSSSSSEASHLDVSASSRLTAWPEQSLSSASTSQEGPRPAAAQAPGEAMLGASRPPPKPLRPRQLQEVGRQSSSDSGIATGSHSSYSGSLSSYAGSSLDVWRATDELGSLLSLPAAGAPEPSLCACLPGAVEYQVPTSLRPHYDTPRSLRLVPRDHSPASQGSPGDSAAGDSGGQTSAGCPSGWLGTRRRGLVMEAPQGSEATLPSPAPGEPWEAGSPHAGPSPAFFSACPVCGGLKGVAASAPGPVTAHSGSPGPVAVDSPGPERPRGEPPAYVNIPVSPPSGKQLHYMGLELQEASEGVRGASASLYAQIDIAATEMAHKVGAQHARAREEQLSELEQRKAAPQ
uniref:Docking protein 7 n=1 Tax=Macaca mulatta TaxID=9544 RepID=A0A5F8AU88_MACMU